MVSLLKTFGKGILYVIGLPFFLVALVLFGAVGLIAFIVQLFMSIFYFFSGRKFFPDLPEDLELRALREGPRVSDNDEEEKEEEPITQAYTEPYTMPQQEQPTFIYPFFEEAPKQEETITEETPVNEEESEPELPIEEEEQKPDPVLFNDNDSSVEETIETTSEEEDEEEEELETYVPRSSSFSVNDDDTEEESGVDIKYDL